MDSGKLETLIDVFLTRNKMITPENAKDVYEFLMKYELNWECVSINLYRDIISAAGEACRLLDKRDEAISLLEQHIKNFMELYENARNYVSDLYFQLGMCYAQKRNREKALDAYRNWIFHALFPSQGYSGYEFFSFRTCSEYSINDLGNNTITMSNPAKFNDPLDCLIFRKYEIKLKDEHRGDDEYMYELEKEALSYIKIKCFVLNKPLPTIENANPSSRSDVEERYNPLMWAHYADGHRGFCVKYKFPSNKTKKTYSSYSDRCDLFRWQNVKYVKSKSTREALLIEGSFFTKSDVWEYEHEVRLLHYDPTWKGDYKPIKLPPGCVKEVYFGLKCSEENKQAIRKALAGQEVKFFQIETQPHDFYKLTSRQV